MPGVPHPPPPLAGRYRISQSFLAAARLGDVGTPGMPAPPAPPTPPACLEEPGLFADMQRLCCSVPSPEAVSGGRGRCFVRGDGSFDLDTLAERCAPREGHTLRAMQEGYLREKLTAEAKLGYASICERVKASAVEAHKKLAPGMPAGDALSRLAMRGEVIRCYPRGVVERLMELHASREGPDSLLCFMLAVSFLERTLTGIVVWGHAHSGKSQALTMRQAKATDVLQSPFLEKVLGQPLLITLRAFIGPLHGLTLRNIVWHNFVSSAEWPPCYTTLLLGILLSLPSSDLRVSSKISGGKSAPLHAVLTELNRDPSETGGIRSGACRDLYAAAASRKALLGVALAAGARASTPAQPVSDSFLEGCGHALMQVAERRADSHKGGSLFQMGVWVGHLRDFHGIALVPHEVHAALIDAVGCGGAAEGLLRSSAFFLPSRGAEWRRGFSSFLNEDWWAACAQLTVLLESGLRRAHAACNGADAMWRIPEEDRLFATVDDLLAPRHTAKVVESRQGGGVPTPGGVEGVEAEAEAEAEAESARPANATLGFLGPGATSVLYDHWVWTEGVRARDDVAHASVLPEDVPPEASSAVLAVALWCAVRCCPEGVGAGGLGVVLRWVEGYRAQLSPWSLFGAESRLYTGKAREALRARCALVAERGSGFPPPPAGSKVVTVEERDSLNARRSDDPNRLPGDAAGLAAEVRALRGGGGGGGVPEPDIASLVFSGKITNATNRELIKFGMLRKIVAACYSFAERLAGTYDSMFDLVWSRRAYKKQRISYARLVMDIGDLADMADLAFEFAQLNATRDIDSGELLRESCLNFIYSLMHQAELKQWYRCLPEYAAFTEKLKEFLAQQPPPPPG